MADRTGSGCVVASTKVIPQGLLNPQPISTINVITNVDINYAGAVPVASLSGGNPIANVKPIKSLMETYVYPVFRFHFFNFYGGVANYPLLNIKVKILPVGAPEPPCEGNNCPEITCSILHPFMNAAENIVPAYCIKKNDLIFLDPTPTAMVTPMVATGKVVSVSLVPPQDLYGLFVMDETNAQDALTVATSFMDELNDLLAAHWQENVDRHEQLQLSASPVEASEFACSTFADLLIRDFPQNPPPVPPAPPVIHGLQLKEFMIITDSVATGTLDVQFGYHNEAREGFALGNLIP
jgi:hypothetical protein